MVRDGRWSMVVLDGWDGRRWSRVEGDRRWLVVVVDGRCLSEVNYYDKK